MSSNLFGLSAASFYALGKKNNSTSPSGNYVTLDTVQTITANKIFANLNVQNILGVDIGVQGNIYLTGFIQFGDGSIQSTATPSTQSYVTVDTTQTITGEKTFSQSTYFNLLNAAVVSTPSVNVTTITFGDGSTQTTATTNAQISTTTAQGGTYYPVFTLGGQGSNNATPYTSGNLSFDNVNNLMTLPNLNVYGQLNVNSTDAYTRQIYSSYYNFYDGANLSPAVTMGRIYADTGGFKFDLSSYPSSTFHFYANDGGTLATPLVITPVEIQANTHFHIPNQTSIRLGAFQQTVGANSGRILQQSTYTVIANNATGGAINLTTTSTSNQFATQLSVSSALVALTADNNTAPTATPGNNTTTIATTAFVQSAVAAVVGSSTYTLQYTTTQSITLPANCIGIDVRCVGQGGLAGNSSDGNGGSWGAGGSGGGGGTCYNFGIIPLYGGTILQLNFSGYTEILLTSYGSASLCRANNGGNGSNASGSNGGAAGVGGGAINLNATFGDWTTRNGTNGLSGSSNNTYQNYAQIPASAGYPIGIPYIDSPPNFGCGQRWGTSFGINTPQDPPYPPLAITSGVCFITYYLK